MQQYDRDVLCKCNQPISYVLFDLNVKMEERLLCNECALKVQKQEKIIVQEDLKLITEVIHLMESTYFQKIQYLEALVGSSVCQLEKFLFITHNLKSQLMQQINELIRIQENWMLNLQSKITEKKNENFIKQLDSLITQVSHKDAFEQVITKEVENIHQSWIPKAKSVLDNIKNNQLYQKCHEVLQNFNKKSAPPQCMLASYPFLSINVSMSVEDVLQDFIQEKGVPMINGQINKQYQQIQQELTYKSDKQYCAFAFHKSRQLLVGACLKHIKGYVINKGQLKFISTMIGHVDNVRVTQFMKVNYKNILISASEDKSLRVWSYTQMARPKFLQKINAHLNGILCFTLNQAEDLLITGSRDTTLKFWKQSNYIQNGCILGSCIQTINQHSHNIYDLSLSQKEDKLISCSEDSRILIISLVQSEWKQFGFRLSFIGNNMFTFQPRLANLMDVYELNQNGQFIKSFDVQVKGGNQDCRIFFPQQYISEKNLLINKNGFHINIIKVIERKVKESQKQQNVQFVVEQSISFGQESTGLIFGQLSDNAEYLITWDSKTKELQMRQSLQNIYRVELNQIKQIYKIFYVSRI